MVAGKRPTGAVPECVRWSTVIGLRLVWLMTTMTVLGTAAIVFVIIDFDVFVGAAHRRQAEKRDYAGEGEVEQSEQHDG